MGFLPCDVNGTWQQGLEGEGAVSGCQAEAVTSDP